MHVNCVPQSCYLSGCNRWYLRDEACVVIVYLTLTGGCSCILDTSHTFLDRGYTSLKGSFISSLALNRNKRKAMNVPIQLP